MQSAVFSDHCHNIGIAFRNKAKKPQIQAEHLLEGESNKMKTIEQTF